MPRYRLTIEYDGSPFVGWQRQDNGPSVQQALEEAVVRFCGQHCSAVGAGRTDAGVHALGQVAHVDLPRLYEPTTVRDAVNFHLRPQPVAILDAAVVADTFHARYSAIRRRYLYRILNRRAAPTLDRGRVWWLSQPLDVPAMAAAARRLVGHHDFSSFRSSACQARSPVKTLDALTVTTEGAEIRVRAEARSFLHNQVRILVGTVKWVGEGRWSATDVAAALAARDRRCGGPTAPAEGLYLAGIHYPGDGPSLQHVRSAADQDADEQVKEDEADGGPGRDTQCQPGNEP
jgi:tRNA pseudouridine38-40 synthase